MILLKLVLKFKGVLLLFKEKYHHGDLKAELLKKGLYVLNKEGYEGFSLRKVAALCNVSHAAPYKHFSNKEALIKEIIADVAVNFTFMLEEANQRFSDDPKAKVLEMGKQYVKFMVENPDYFKFLFLTNHHRPILITDDTFILDQNHVFNIARKCDMEYFASINLDEKRWTRETLAIWSLLQGFTVLMVYNTINYTGDYLVLISKIIEEKLESLKQTKG
jgi:AcrR family transcriptional regulator